eukprot:scaffold23789_cov142-Isochrysis_galbana.AAC.2
MSGVKTSHSMGGARADRAPSVSVLQPPILSYKPLGSGRPLARSYLAGFFGTRAHLPTRHHHRLPQVAVSAHTVHSPPHIMSHLTTQAPIALSKAVRQR